jgi:hypothetical protein
MEADKYLAIWTVYLRPANHPEIYIAHKSLAVEGLVVPTGEILAAHTLEALRAKLPFGLYPTGRAECDAPDIVETWF